MNPSSFALLGTGAEDCTHGRTRTRERQQLITDFPDSNRFHRLLLFDYASALNEPGRCFWYGTPVGVRRSVSVRVLLSAFVRDHAVDPPRDSSVGRALHSMAIL